VPDAWDNIDALAFESVGDASSDGVEMSRILGFIDYVDRTVLNHAEMERALQRLLGSGLVEETTHGFRRTATGQELHARCPSTFPRDRARWIERFLHDRIVCQPTTNWSLPIAHFTSALAAYHEEMRRLIERNE
jgi:hypothetical protein